MSTKLEVGLIFTIAPVQKYLQYVRYIRYGERYHVKLNMEV